MSFVELDNNFKLPEGFNPDDLNHLRIHKHRYGQEMELNPTELYWTEYQPFQPGDGTISFARKLYLKYPEVAVHVRDYMQGLFPDIPFDIERVNLLKTVGSIRRHMDESSRKCCINIGIINSTGAITKASTTRNHEEYLSNAKEYQCQDNHAYLLDTSRLHQVVALNDNPRYLFTYGFGIDFEIILKNYQKP